MTSDSNTTIVHYQRRSTTPNTTTKNTSTTTTIKEGTLTRARRDEYYVLNQSSLICYNNRHLDKLKKQYFLPYINNVVKGNEKNEFILSSDVHELDLRAEDAESCTEWMHAISTAVSNWFPKELNDVIEDIENDFSMIKEFPCLRVSLEVSCVHDVNLRGECAMMKYARDGKSIPHERVFKMDEDLMQVMWRKPGRRSILNNFCVNNCLFIGDVMEVRLGQQTKNFNDFPYAEVGFISFKKI